MTVNFDVRTTKFELLQNWSPAISPLQRCRSLTNSSSRRGRFWKCIPLNLTHCHSSASSKGKFSLCMPLTIDTHSYFCFIITKSWFCRTVFEGESGSCWKKSLPIGSVRNQFSFNSKSRESHSNLLEWLNHFRQKTAWFV